MKKYVHRTMHVRTIVTIIITRQMLATSIVGHMMSLRSHAYESYIYSSVDLNTASGHQSP